MQNFPRSLGNLRALKSLDASHNRLQPFPDVVCSLRLIDAIDLSGNKITAVPDTINQLQAIEVNLNLNQVHMHTSLPPPHYRPKQTPQTTEPNKQKRKKTG